MLAAALFVLALSLPRPDAVPVLSREAAWCVEYLASRERQGWN